MNSLPTVSQIREVQRLLATELFEVPAIARLTGVRLRDVFQIARFVALTPIDIAPDGTVIDGQHRLAALAN